MKLNNRAVFSQSGEPFLARIESRDSDGRFRVRLLDTNREEWKWVGFDGASGVEVVLPADLSYLALGDILRFNPHAREIHTLYRKNSRHNFLLFTDRCNSRCLMCSQPPRDVDDSYLVEDILKIVPWMDRSTPELGITGGEPTLLNDKLVAVLKSAREHLPETAVHVLTNGRLFKYLQLARRVADVKHPDLMLGIPLYADIASVHDFVVQAAGAFDETVRGLLNLARVGVRIELRMVIHSQTYERLALYARFVARNLPFVSQVSLMGMEQTGFARSNMNALWMDPLDYQNQLYEAVSILSDSGLRVHIFNHPLCVLPPSLQSFARQSISDWKNIYLSKCEECSRKAECGGFFASTFRFSRGIKPFAALV